MIKTVGFIVSYSCSINNGQTLSLGNLSFSMEGFFWKILYPSEKMIVDIIKKGHPNISSIAIQGIVEISGKRWREWKKINNPNVSISDQERTNQ